jgi:hypothetical protein
MAQKTLCEYSTPSTSQVLEDPEVDVGTGGFEIRTGLIMVVQSSPLCGKNNEDTSAICNSFLSCATPSPSKG